MIARVPVLLVLGACLLSFSAHAAADRSSEPARSPRAASPEREPVSLAELAPGAAARRAVATPDERTRQQAAGPRWSWWVDAEPSSVAHVALAAGPLDVVPGRTSGATTFVTICHCPPGNPERCRTIQVLPADVDAHLRNHGDTLGPCPGDESPIVP